MEKKCIKCGETKELGLFPKSGNICKVCKAEYRKQWKANNKDKVSEHNAKYYVEHKDERSEYDKEYYASNKEKRKEYIKVNSESIKKYRKIYRKKNRNKINEYNRIYVRRKKDDDPVYKLKLAIRNRIYCAITRKGYTKSSKTQSILGCDYETFKNHIESQFEDWMNWDNYGKYNGEYGYGWDIDHIIPCGSAVNECELLKLNHYTNLQPLCSYINRDVKIDKVDF